MKNGGPLPDGGGGIVGVAIHQPVFTTMVMAGLIVLGVFSLGHLGMEELPDVSFPMVTIQTVYPGASPEAVESAVTKPIEEAVNTTQGVKRVSSQSLDSVSSITVEMNLGTPIPSAVADIRSNIEQITRDLPSGIDPPIVQQFDPAAQPIISLALSSATLSIPELTELADGSLRHALESIEGVGAVRVNGGVKRELHVLLDPKRMAARGLSPAEIKQALERQNVDAPAGHMESGNRELLVHVVSRLTNLGSFGRVIVAVRDGRPVRLSDVAVIRNATEEPESAARINGTPAVGIDLLKVSGANTVTVGERVRAVIAQLGPALPREATLTVIRDSSVFVRSSVLSVGHELLAGAALTILIVLLFLNDARATVITALTLPVSVVSAFILMYALNFTLNTLTLMALSLSIGLLIDDAIVVIENIVRRRELGEAPATAAYTATREIFLAVMATTFSIVAVFVPVAFMGGVVGKYFYQFGVTVAWAVLVSLFVSFTLTPMLAAWWMPRGSEQAGVIRRHVARFNHAFDRLAVRYRGVIAWVLGHRKTTVAGALLSFVAATGLAPLIGGASMPDMDSGEFSVIFKVPAGSSLAYTEAKAQHIERVLRSLPGVGTTYATVGGDLTSGTDQGNVFVKLLPLSGRTVSQQEVMTLARAALANVYAVRTNVAGTSGPSGPKPIQVLVRGPDLGVLAELSGRVVGVLGEIPGVIEVESGLGDPGPEVRLTVDREKASARSLNAAAVAGTVPIFVAGTRATTWKTAQGERSVIIRLPVEARSMVSDLGSLPVTTVLPGQSQQTTIPVSQISRLTMGSGPSSIERQDLARVVRVSANLAAGFDVSKVSARIQPQLDRLTLPADYAVEMGGDTAELEETMGYVLQAILLAVIMIYLILASQFGSFIQPLAIMLSLPLSLVGVMVALLLTRDTFNTMSVMGVIMLMGLVTKNAILLVDNANHHRKMGMARSEALIEAGETRLRPIVMTTLAMIFGMFPIALGLGEGGGLRAPMARAVIGGLITSTLLTLGVVPVVYAILDDVGTWVRGLADKVSRRKREDSGKAPKLGNA